MSVDRPDAAFIEELVRRGVTSGCQEGMFCPDKALQRADAALVVLRLLEGAQYVPPASTTSVMFDDMAGDPRAAWVRDAVSRGLFTHCAAGERFFCPNEGITRADAAVAAAKSFNLPLF